MSKCGKGCLPECEYFTTGGCISPFNCMYKQESGYINSATSGTVIYTGGMNMTNEEMIENLKCVIADISEQCEQLKSENAALRERLSRAVELPCIEPMTTWDWDANTGCGKAHFGKFWKVLYRDNDGEFIAYMGATKEEATAMLAELKGEKK